MRFTVRMTTGTPSRPRRTTRTAVGRRSRTLRIRIGSEVKNLREDAGLSIRRLAAAAGIDDGYLSQVERGIREPSLTVLVAIAEALGGDASVRLYPGTGPRLRDPIQARIVEEVLRTADPRWQAHVEVPVHRPARGVIDVVLRLRDRETFLAIEVHSELRRLEQQIRWAAEKAESLPSADIWPRDDLSTPVIHRVLILRRTRTNRELAHRFSATLATAYPAPAPEAYRALVGAGSPWPGSTFLWATVDGDTASLSDLPISRAGPHPTAPHRTGPTQGHMARP